MDSGASSSITNLRMMNQEFVKLDRFDGCNYTRWAEKMKFLLIVLKIYYVLDPTLPPISGNLIPEAGNPVDEKKMADLEKERMLRKDDETLCCGHIKNSLSDRLYDLYASITDPRELWNALEFKYKAQEEGTNKYLVSKYMEFSMVDGKSILEQVHELQILVNKLKALSITLPEVFQVGAIITKLPPSWKDFSKRMMHKSEDYSLDVLIKHLRIEEETKTRENMSLHSQKFNVHHVQAGNSSKRVSRNWSQNSKLGVNRDKFKKNAPMKRSGKCHVCGEAGHYARECPQRKSGFENVNVVANEMANMVSHVSLNDGDLEA